MKSGSQVAIIFHRLGPYHKARLEAASAVLDLLVIEESADTSDYGWAALESEIQGSHRHTLIKTGERPIRAARTIARRTCRVLETHKPSVVVIPGWSDPAALAALLWANKNGSRTVIMSASTVLDGPRSPWKEHVKSRVVRCCDTGLAGGAPQAEYLEALGMPAERVFIGYDVVDNSHFALGAQRVREQAFNERRRLQLPEHYFLASSRFLAQKNLFTLLEAYADYKCSRSDCWSLVMLGDGPLRAQLTARRDALGLREQVLFPGFKQYDELPCYYGMAGAFVHASLREPWGLVVNEAMAAGLPVLVSNRCGCARDLVCPGENGFTFNPEDRHALAQLLERITACSPERRSAMGHSSARIIARWSPNFFAQNLVQAVETACTSPRRPAKWPDRGLLKLLICKAERMARQLLRPN